MILNVVDMLEWIEESSLDKVLMFIRTIGPDNCTDEEKKTNIYAAYAGNLEGEHPGLFNTILNNEFAIVEFDTESNASEFAQENFPYRAADVDPDYFVQVFIFVDGGISFANDNLTGLSSRIPRPVQ